ncbi:MAG: tRNA uridine-5-carboxymethylaminomethyl(34) synthesis GTPase MnmE [Pseudomonadota bacterium]
MANESRTSQRFHVSEATIYAPATAPGRAALSIVRVSGSRTAQVLQSLTRQSLPLARRATLCSLCDPGSSEQLDQALVLWFPAPGSATGEDLAELHLHGGPAVLSAVLQVLGQQEGLRLAEPGEFARRAFANGKLDLTQVEGLADLVAAETAGQRRQALAQTEGALSAKLADWRERLLLASSRVEAAIDFAEEADVTEGLLEEAAASARSVLEEIETATASAARGERLRQGLRCSLLGPPNAGKSSLINALVGRDAAIVSERPGTTRDLIEVALDLDGLPVTVTDGAGLNPETDDVIEQEGMRRALASAETADLVILLQDLSQSKAPRFQPQAGQVVLRVGNKRDLVSAVPDGLDLAVSVKTGEGVSAFLELLAQRAKTLLEAEGAPALVTRARQAEALREAALALSRCDAAALPELLAEDLRLAIRALGKVAGTVDVEDLLDRVFRDFCIGK